MPLPRNPILNVPLDKVQRATVEAYYDYAIRRARHAYGRRMIELNPDDLHHAGVGLIEAVQTHASRGGAEPSRRLATLKSWISSCVRRHVRFARIGARRKDRRWDRSSLAHQFAADYRPLSDTIGDDAFEHLIRATGERAKALLGLVYRDGCNFAEVATRMGVTRSCVCKRHDKALEIIRKTNPLIEGESHDPECVRNHRPQGHREPHAVGRQGLEPRVKSLCGDGG